MPNLDIALFGPPRAERDGVPVSFHRHQTLALLAYLAVTDQPHSRDALAALFWPELDESEAHAALRRGLYDLGQTIGKEWLTIDRARLALRPGAGVDVRRFCSLVSHVNVHRHAPGQLCGDCLAALSEAAILYRGDFLAGFTFRGSAEFDDWQSVTTENLRLALAGALERLAAGLGARGEFDHALVHARRWLALDPLDEASQRLLMQLHAWAGDRAAAARQYEACVRVLAAELGIEPAPETAALFQALIHPAPAPGGKATALLAAAPPVSAHNLPADVTPFIGRDATLTQVGELLADPACRLLTVLGPGGIGKTRLAVQVARGQVTLFPHGVHFVDLAPLPSAELLSSAILRVLDAPSRAAAAPDEHLLDFVRDKRLLLVLDNYEHLLTGADPNRRDGYGLVTRLAAAAPQVKLLVTSRARLNVAAEWLMPLEGLVTPPEAGENPAHLLQAAAEEVVDQDNATVPSDQSTNSQSTISQSTLAQYSATALCLACIRRVQPGFRPSEAETQTIARICRLVDGVPPAIELAAAWARALPLDEIARRLQGGLDLLTTTLRGAPPRQRSMVATFDYSWQLLDPRERSILRQIAVFRGGFTAEAAAAVAGACPADLALLVDTSWLRLDRSGRYTGHELVRQYCAAKLECEHLAEAGEIADQVRDRHAAHYHAFTAARWSDFGRRTEVIPELLQELGNLWAATDWTLVHEELALFWGLGLGLVLAADRAGLNGVWERSLAAHAARLRLALHEAQEEDGQRLTRSVLLLRCVELRTEPLSRLGREAEVAACLDEMGRLLETVRGDARWAEAYWFYRRAAAWHRFALGDVAGAAQQFGELVADIRAGRVSIWPNSAEVTRAWICEVGAGQAHCAGALGEYDEARRLAVEYSAVAGEIGSDLGRAFVVYPLVWALLNLGAYGQAEREARWLLRTLTAYGDTMMACHALTTMGWTQYYLGRYERARTWWRRGLSLARRIALAGAVAECLVGQGYAALALGDPDAARQCFEESCALDGLAQVALRQGRPVEALALLRQVLRQPGRAAWATAGALRGLAEALLRTGETARSAEICGFLVGWRGAPYRIKEGIEQLLRELEALLPPADLAAALERGRQQKPEAIAAQFAGEA